jgi:signal transduction histidine kinase
LPSNTVLCLRRDFQGTIWAGTTVGPAKLVDGRFITPDITNRAISQPIVALTAWRSNHMLAATETDGAWELVDEHWQRLTVGQPELRNVTAFFLDADGFLWLASRGDGLRLVTDVRADLGQTKPRPKSNETPLPATFRFTVKDGLYDDTIFGIAADKHDALWMACSEGVFTVSRADLLKFASGQLRKVTSTPFSPMESQRTIECRDGAAPVVWRMDDGRIWFSTIRGVLVADPERVQPKLPPTPVVIEEIIVNGKSEPLTEILRLPPDATNVSIRYAALSFVTPTRITFRYRLDGFDRDWVEAGARREAFYTNLPPGNYRFQVQAFNVDGVYHALDAPLPFTIMPHIYQQPWFMAVCVLALAGGAWAIYRLRVQRIKARLRLVVAERSRIARELHDTLMQGFSGITMAMQALSARLPTSPERSTLDDIIRDAGQCLREARRSIAGLRDMTTDERSGLAAALAQAARQLTETQDIQLHLKLDRGPQDLPADVAYNILRIAQEAITNAVNHADCGEIVVELEATARSVRVSITDDGAGFDVPADQTGRIGHYGLIGMRERANQIGAQLNLTSAPDRGTQVTIVLPLPASIRHNSNTAASTV